MCVVSKGDGKCDVKIVDELGLLQSATVSLVVDWNHEPYL